MNTQLTPQQQNDLLAICHCCEAGKVEVVTCPDKNNIWLKTFVKWAYLLSQTGQASSLIITNSTWGEQHAIMHLMAYMQDMTEEELVNKMTESIGNSKVSTMPFNDELWNKMQHLNIYFTNWSPDFDLAKSIRSAQAQTKLPLYVLMEHYTGTDKTEQAKDFAFVQQVAQETNVPITLIQYNNEVF